MHSERFRFALKELKPSDWERFEHLASVFLAADYPELRTLAAPSGDAGRDATLFHPSDQQNVAIQYSVTEDWRGKIRRTCKRLAEGFPDQVRVLVYVTNQQIGASADDVRKVLLKEDGLYLDVRDINWFVERMNASDERQIAAEELVQLVVNPILSEENLIQSKGRALTSHEARAGLVYLTLQWEDDTREKGLTRLSYEALVRAALRGTDPDNRLTREDVYRRVGEMVPSHPRDFVIQHVDSALGRFTKTVVRHYQKEDLFCLTFQERERLSDRLAAVAVGEEEFGVELSTALRSQAHAMEIADFSESPQLLERVRTLFERFLFQRGEAFASAVVTAQLRTLDVSNLRDLIVNNVAAQGDSNLGGRVVDVIAGAIEEVIFNGGPAAQLHLRQLSDAYTLFAFLRETEDVQAAVGKMFSHGELWLDTTVLLPALAETLLDPGQRRFTKLLTAATASGLDLRITPGVLEELERHLNKCHACLRSHDWRGRTPFLLGSYVAAGLPMNGFPSWAEAFAGTARPMDDIAEYLKEAFRIGISSLEEHALKAGVEIRSAVQEIWHAAHARRRGELDEVTLQRLVIHDVENYVGVIQRRNRERDSALGYTSWWISIDPTAFAVHSLLEDQLQDRVPDSPVMSPDFLVNYLALGPVRRNISKEAEQRLPVVYEIGLHELPRDVLSLADAVRLECANLPERLVMRRVRDTLDKAKRRQGVLAREGIAGAQHRIQEQLTILRNARRP